MSFLFTAKINPINTTSLIVLQAYISHYIHNTESVATWDAALNSTSEYHTTLSSS